MRLILLMHRQVQNGSDMAKSEMFDIFESAVRNFSYVRQNFTIPHYLNAMDEYKENRNPLIRPMWWSITEEHSDLQSRIQIIDNQFMIGPDMVVISYYNRPNREIYLPKGTWCDPLYGTGSVTSKGDFIIYHTKSTVACFIRCTGAVKKFF